MKNTERKAFRIVEGKGVQMDLPNGVTVSIQFGPSNYADADARRQHWDAPKRAMAADEYWGSDLAECAAYVTGSNLSWVAVPGYTDAGGDDVCGYMNVSQVLDFINRASQIDAKPNPNSLGNRMFAALEAGEDPMAVFDDED